MKLRKNPLVAIGVAVGVALALALMTAGAGVALAQRTGPQGERWDEDEVVTLEGKVKEVERPFATFEADGKTYTVHLGPSWFWQERGYTLTRGDQVTITGEVSVEGKASHLYLTSLVRGDTTYRFADDDGVPLWSGGRGRGRGWGSRGGPGGPGGEGCWHHARCGHGPHGHGPCGAPCCGTPCCGR